MIVAGNRMAGKRWGAALGRALLPGLVAAVMTGGMLGCAEKPVAVTAIPGAATTGQGTAAETGQAREQALMTRLGIETEAERQQFLKNVAQFRNDDIFFPYDSYLLSADAKRILDRKVVFLQKYPAVQVTIEGHCDERGTSEYNLALGERRAKSAWQYLVNSGVNPNLLDVLSYGEERPLVMGHGESSWARNRRAHFDLIY